MENIEVGEYVRTKEYGDIGKLLKITSSKAYLDSIGYAIDRDEIKNHSKNIIDLIEVGDYVNGYKITDFDNDYYDYEIDGYIEGKSIVLGNEEQMYRIPPKDIKSIVTKEQFAQMEYKVKE